MERGGEREKRELGEHVARGKPVIYSSPLLTLRACEKYRERERERKDEIYVQYRTSECIHIYKTQDARAKENCAVS